MLFSTLDELATWMLTNIRLSRYDDQFINNLTLYITSQKRITTNQDTLFKRVARKYHRQFSHHKINVENELLLHWSVDVVESLPEYTGANIKIENDKIIFRSPYNKNFLAALRKNTPYSLVWVKEKKQYEANYSPTVLKQLIYLSAEHYTVLNYCDTVTQIINTLSEYDSVKYWVPTLVYNKGYYIAAINEHVYEATKHIELSSDLKSIAQLVKYGITVDQSVKDELLKTEHEDRVKLATEFHATVELRDIKTIMSWLKEFGCDAINESKTLLTTPWNISLASECGIDICRTTKSLRDYKNPVAVYLRGSIQMFETKPIKLMKIIRVVNSEPVNLGPK
jgi:hypothetical protein